MGLGLLLSILRLWMFRASSPRRVDKWFRRLQLVSAAALQPGPRRQRRAEDDGDHRRRAVHRRLSSTTEFTIPFWVILAAHAAIGLGTLSGGWRIVHTMGSKITKLQPFGGFAAETAGAITLFTATSLGIPVSTTHTITGAIIGVGSVRRLSAVRWGVARQIVWAWILTIPGLGGDCRHHLPRAGALRHPLTSSSAPLRQGRRCRPPVRYIVAE